MLILFDVDMTLIRTGGVGMDAMVEAVRERHGPAVDGHDVSFGGRLDPLIIADLLTVAGAEPSPDAIGEIRRLYAQKLAARLEHSPDAAMLPGVAELLDAVERLDGVVMGLLTGNFPETGRLKLERCGLAPERFPVAVWGDASPALALGGVPAREHLPPVAMAIYERTQGRRIEPADVVIVGDTTHDVACATANGCRVLGVATGYATRAELEAAGADRVVDDLRATAEIVSWLAGRGRAPAGSGRGGP